MLNLLQAGRVGRYTAALNTLKAWMVQHLILWDVMSEEDQDFLVADYILDARDEGDLQPQHARDLISALQKLNPRRRLHISWRVVNGWALDRPAEQALPLPCSAALALSVLLVGAGKPGVGLGVLLCWCGLLRVGESLALKIEDVRIVGAEAILFLGHTKRGVAERVVLINPGVVLFLREYLRRRGGRPWDRVIVESHTTFRRWFMLGLRALGITDPYRSHSLRRGGATAMFMNGAPLSSVMIYGRWASETSCRLYIRTAEVIMLRSEAAWTPAVRARLVALASLGHGVFKLVDGSFAA